MAEREKDAAVPIAGGDATAVPLETPRPGGERLSRLGLALLAGLILVWGFNWPMVKLSLVDIPPWTHRAYTCMIGGVILVLLCVLARQPLAVPRRDWGVLGVSAFLNVTVWQNLMAFSILQMNAGQAAVLAFTMPLWTVMIGAVWLRTPVRPGEMLALALGMAGIALMLFESLDGNSARPAGMAMILIAAAAWAVGTLLVKRHDWGIRPLSLATWQLLVGGVPTVAMAAWEEGLEIGHAGTPALLALTYTVVLAIVFAYYAWFSIVALLPVAAASLGTLLIPVIGVISGMIVLGERVTVVGLIAIVLIVSGVALVFFRPRALLRLRRRTLPSAR